MAEKRQWYCARQTAGSLVKECRAIRPRLSSGDTPYERTEKNKILRPRGDSSVCRSRVDRLELRLALFGHEGRAYVLTFDTEHEPHTFDDVRKAWRSFLRRLKLHAGKPIDYVYLIEGRHGDHRYHMHLILRDSDFKADDVRALWKFGRIIYDQPMLMHERDTYRRTAKYYCKEQTDGVVIPISARQWVSSRTLSAKIPPSEHWRATSGWIPIPEDCSISGTYSTSNEFGQYRYAWYIT